MLQPNDSSWVAQRMVDSVNILEAEQLRPCILFRARVFQDGNMFCALFGDNIQEGIVGFGETPDEATREFDKAWYIK